MEIKDLAGLSKPLTRLIEVVSKGVGAVATPYLIKSTADAKAYEIKVIANALKNVREQNQLPVVYDGGVIEVWQKPDDNTLILDKKPIDERATSRLEFQERKRQNNIENITAIAAGELLSETDIPDNKPDDDWVSRFFSSAQDITSQEMQQLWGKILAGEIKKPGSYSLRTLDFVKNITKAEAEAFEKIGKLALRAGGVAFVVAQDKQWLQENKGVFPTYHFLMGELGIMFPTDLTYSMFMDPNSVEEALLGDNELLVVKRGGIKSKIEIRIWKFTGVGLEMLPLIQRPFDEEYLEYVGRILLTHKGEPIIAKIIERLPNNQILYNTIKKVA